MADTSQPAGQAAAGAQTPASPSRDEIVAAFTRQRAHQWNVRRRTPAERVGKLQDLKRAIVAHREALLDAMHEDFRKNRSEAGRCRRFSSC